VVSKVTCLPETGTAKGGINVRDKRIISAIGALLATTALTAGQAPQTAPRPASEPPAATTQQTPATLVGCLYREDQVPGRKPNVAERAGVLEDYILADAAMPSGQAKPGAVPGAVGTSGTTPASGNMYKVEGPSDERLKALVGKKVEVTGRIDPEGSDATAGGPRPDRGPGPDAISLPEFEATTVREVSGTCPASPAPAK
jgi:hypothetical protein